MDVTLTFDRPPLVVDGDDYRCGSHSGILTRNPTGAEWIAHSPGGSFNTRIFAADEEQAGREWIARRVMQFALHDAAFRALSAVVPYVNPGDEYR